MFTSVQEIPPTQCVVVAIELFRPARTNTMAFGFFGAKRHCRCARRFHRQTAHLICL